MTKERAQRLKLILERVSKDSNLEEDRAADEAMIGLIGEALTNLARIADALETIAKRGQISAGYG